MTWPAMRVRDVRSPTVKKFIGFRSFASKLGRTHVQTLFHSHLASARCHETQKLGGNRLNGFCSLPISLVTRLKPCVNETQPVLLRQSRLPLDFHAAVFALSERTITVPLLPAGFAEKVLTRSDGGQRAVGT